MYSDVQTPVLALDIKRLREVIDHNAKVTLSSCGDGKTLNPFQNCDLYSNLILHEFIKSRKADEFIYISQRRTMIYVLANFGVDVNAKDEDGNTALHLAITHLNGDLEICEPLLQFGADLYIFNKVGHTPMDLLTFSDAVPKIVHETFEKYTPGLWKAVDNDDLQSVRRLINLWCSVDISKDGKLLKDFALEKGTEYIIRLILEISPSMRLAHNVLADDFVGAKNVLKGNKKVNIEFKNLGDMGATPLFYAITQNNPKLVDLLASYGAKSSALITLEEEEIPILFAALNAEIDTEIIQRLIPPSQNNPQSLLKLHYRGQHILQHCIKSDVSLAAIRHILQQGYSDIVAVRGPDNMCSRDVAEKLQKNDYAKVIDEVVHDWYLDSSSQHSKILAYQGYPHLSEAEKDGVRACEVIQSMETSSGPAQFHTQLKHYKEQIKNFISAIEEGNLEQVKTLSLYRTTSETSPFQSCLLNCKGLGDAQPPLHKAVLRGHQNVTQFIAKGIVQNLGQKIDDVRDGSLRTPLHYAYALDNKFIINVLLEHGASDFTMDKDGHSPLVFRDLRGQSAMDELLQYHLLRDFSELEPDPFSMAQRLHHVKLARAKAMKDQQQNQHHHHSSTPPENNQPSYNQNLQKKPFVHKKRLISNESDDLNRNNQAQLKSSYGSWVKCVIL